MENLGYIREDSSLSTISTQRDVLQAEINAINATADVTVPLTDCCSKFRNLWKNYQWRMRDYFYIHLSVFFFNTLLSGFIIWNIERQDISFIDCWFISSTCVFTCGLQTYPFGSFSRASQIILLLLTLISGITVSTIPDMLIRIYRIKREIDNQDELSNIEDNTLPIRQFVRPNVLDSELNRRLQSLPNAKQLRITAHIILIIAILSTCFMIYLLSFLSIGIWLKYQYTLQDMLIANATVNPFYASLVISITGFNQNGLTVWKNGMSLFVEDIFLNIIIMIIVISGTSLFPAILRGVISLSEYVAPWRYKIYFDYILLNNHRLSTVIYPSIQTRLYVTITILLQILGVTVALILDYHSSALMMYDGGYRFLIFMFQVLNTRFAGFSTIIIDELSAGTLLIFVLLMGIKPQMLCTSNETPFEMEWLLLQTQENFENQNLHNNKNQRTSIELFLPIDRMKTYLSRQGSLAKAKAKKHFEKLTRTNRAENSINELIEKRYQHRLSIGSSNISTNSEHLSLLRMKLLFISFCRHACLGLFSLMISTRTWLFIFIFLICCFESSYMIPSNPTITVFRVIFEVISAFGGCGLSMGFSSVTTTSLAAVFSVPSKMVLIFTMCIGRHRGLLDSMKDQEVTEYSAQTLIDSWKQYAVYENEQKRRMKMTRELSSIAITVSPPTPPISTRF